MFEQIRGVVKNYAWGKSFSGSLVAELSESAESNQKYAELWFGTHPSGSITFINSAAAVPSLPYLMKVLSVAKPLSIQVHPNKEQAELLHRSNPEAYPDSNQKLEAAVALGDVSLLAGFKSREVLIDELSETSDLISFFKRFSAELDVFQLFKSLMRLEGDTLAEGLSLVMEYLNKTSDSLSNAAKQVYLDFPNGDVGLFCFVLLRAHFLEKGELVLLKPGLLHAYLSGEILECMTSSDNVVRAGLTEKFKDIENLLKVVDENLQPESALVEPFYFQLNLVDTNSSWDASEIPRVLLCLEGVGRISSAKSAPVGITKGDAFLFDEACSLEIERGLFAFAGV